MDRARLTVVPRLRTRAARIPFVTLVSLTLLAGVVGLLLFNTSMQQASFAASKLEDQATSLSGRQQALVMEIEELRDPQRLADQACRLGMVVGPNPAFLEVTSREVTGVPTTAVAAPCGFEPKVRPVPPAPEDGLVISPGSGASSGQRAGTDR